MRKSWDEYFMGMARLVADRSTCVRMKRGALIVKDRRVLTTGYNGVPVGIRHCIHGNCLREKLNVPSGERHELCRGIHAEQNAILQGALHGVSVRDGMLYCTTFPCGICAKMIINVGIVEVCYEEEYNDVIGFDLLKESGIRIRKLEV